MTTYEQMAFLAVRFDVAQIERRKSVAYYQCMHVKGRPCGIVHGKGQPPTGPRGEVPKWTYFPNIYYQCVGILIHKTK